MSAATSHPEKLPWFAAGTLERGEAASVERHLHDCAECRAEVDALRSMTRTLRAVAPREHIAADRLVAYHTNPAVLSREERDGVEHHLDGCAGCRSDLSALQRADATLRSARRWRPLGFAASLLLVVFAGWQVASWRAPVPAKVVLTPSERGPSQSVPAGPCQLEVFLPVLAKGSTYAASIQLEDGTVRQLGVQAVKDQRVLLTVPEGLPPGHHVLSLAPPQLRVLAQEGAPHDGDGTDVYAYSVDVEGKP